MILLNIPHWAHLQGTDITGSHKDLTDTMVVADMLALEVEVVCCIHYLESKVPMNLFGYQFACCYWTGVLWITLLQISFKK